MKDLQDIISKKITLQMVVKTVNNIASSDSLNPTLLVFWSLSAYAQYKPTTGNYYSKSHRYQKGYKPSQKNLSQKSNDRCIQ